MCSFIERTKNAAAKESQESAAMRQQQILLHQQHAQQTREKAEAIFPILSSKKSQKSKDRDREKGKERSRDNKKKDKEVNKDSENSSSGRRRRGDIFSQTAQSSNTTTRRGPPAGIIDKSDDENDAIDYEDEDGEGGEDAIADASASNNSNTNFENEFPPLPGSSKEKAALDPSVRDGSANELSFAKALSRDRVPVIDDISKSVFSQHEADNSMRDGDLGFNASEISLNNYHHLNDSNMSNFDFNQSSLLYQTTNQSQILDSQQTYFEEEDLDDLVVFRPTFARALPSQATASSQPDLFSLGAPPLEPPPLISSRGFSSLGLLGSSGRLNDFNSRDSNMPLTVGDFSGVFGSSNNSNLGMDWQPWGTESSSNKSFNMGGGSLFESSLKTENIITHPNSAKNSTAHLSDMLGGEGYHSYWDETSFDPVQATPMNQLSKKESVDTGYSLINSANSKLAEYQQPGMYFMSGYGSYNIGGGPSLAQNSDVNIYQSTSSLLSSDTFHSQSTAAQMMPPPPPGLAAANQHNPAAAVPLPPGISLPHRNNTTTTSHYSQSPLESYNAAVDPSKHSLNVE